MQGDTSVLKSILVEFCLERITRFEDFARAKDQRAPRLS